MQQCWIMWNEARSSDNGITHPKGSFIHYHGVSLGISSLLKAFTIERASRSQYPQERFSRRTLCSHGRKAINIWSYNVSLGTVLNSVAIKRGNVLARTISIRMAQPPPWRSSHPKGTMKSRRQVNIVRILPHSIPPLHLYSRLHVAH